MASEYLIIFRIPNDEGDAPLFVQAEFVNGKMATSGKIFEIDDPEDDYLKMGWHHIVLAEKVDVGSCDLGRFDIHDDKHEILAVICEFEATILYAVVEELVAKYEAAQAT